MLSVYVATGSHDTVRGSAADNKGSMKKHMQKTIIANNFFMLPTFWSNYLNKITEFSVGFPGVPHANEAGLVSEMAPVLPSADVVMAK